MRTYVGTRDETYNPVCRRPSRLETPLWPRVHTIWWIRLKSVYRRVVPYNTKADPVGSSSSLGPSPPRQCEANRLKNNLVQVGTHCALMLYYYVQCYTCLVPITIYDDPLHTFCNTKCSCCSAKCYTDLGKILLKSIWNKCSNTYGK